MRRSNWAFEDQEDNRQIVRDLLTANDYEIMDGYEATRRIKTLRECGHASSAASAKSRHGDPRQ